MDSKTLFQKLCSGVSFNKKRILDVNNIFKFKRQKPEPTVDNNLGNSDCNNKENRLLRNETGGRAQREEQVCHLRKEARLHVWGSDVPDPTPSFEELMSEHNLSSLLVQNISNAGYKTPTPIQMQAVPIMLYKREILACAPTGSGKTAAFLIPLIHHLKGPRKKGGPRAVVVVPTRELAQQTLREWERLSQGTHLKCLVIRKAASMALQLERKRGKTNFDILITTPKKLIFLLNHEPSVLSLSKVEWLVVDESDKLFESGPKGFRDQLGMIYQACDGPNVHRALFSATFSCEVQDWCRLHLDNLVTVSVGLRNSAVESVKQELLFVGSESGKLLAIRDLIKKGISPPVLVFVQSKQRAQELFRELVYDGVNVEVIHADRTQTQRDSVVKAFRSGRIWVLLCTELMGRGMDFKGVSLVVNYDLPLSAISYIHQIGRTGRAGRQGHAITFFTENDIPNLRSFAQVMHNAGCEVPEYMLTLKKQNRVERKKLAKRAPARESISTDPKDKKKPQKKIKPSENTTKLPKDNPLEDKVKASIKRKKIPVSSNDDNHSRKKSKTGLLKRAPKRENQKERRKKIK